MFKTYIQLSKLPVVLPVGLTGFTAFYIIRPELSWEIVLVTAGIMFLAFSASAINQIQEINIDAMMERTKHRPLPAGNINKQNASVFAFISFIAGTILLNNFGSFPAMLLGWFNLAWYNLVYTPLKRKTAFAVFPGSLTGAIPPLIGWVAAGGAITDKGALFLSFVFFMAQVPHFWLIILKYGKEYSSAGIPNLTDIFSHRQINRLSFIWITASLFSALTLIQFGIPVSAWIKLLLLGLTIIMLSFFGYSLLLKKKDPEKKNFILLNTYFLVLILLLIMDKSL